MSDNQMWPTGRVVDLSLTLSEELPCTWPGHMPYQQKTFNYFGVSGPPEARLLSPCGEYQTRWILMDEHAGTHMDAPAHFIAREGTEYSSAGPAGSLTAEKVPLELTMGNAAVIDCSALIGTVEPGQSPFIEPDLVEAFEADHGRIEPGTIVLFRSNWEDGRYVSGPEGSTYAEDAVRLHRGTAWPAPSVATVELLLDRGVRCIGIDSPSMGATQDGVPVHLLGLAEGCVYLEALANLKELPPRGAFFVFAPLKVANGSGAPGRAFAVLPE